MAEQGLIESGISARWGKRYIELHLQGYRINAPAPHLPAIECRGHLQLLSYPNCEMLKDLSKRNA